MIPSRRVTKIKNLVDFFYKMAFYKTAASAEQRVEDLRTMNFQNDENIFSASLDFTQYYKSFITDFVVEVLKIDPEEIFKASEYLNEHEKQSEYSIKISSILPREIKTKLALLMQYYENLTLKKQGTGYIEKTINEIKLDLLPDEDQDPSLADIGSLPIPDPNLCFVLSSFLDEFEENVRQFVLRHKIEKTKSFDISPDINAIVKNLNTNLLPITEEQDQLEMGDSKAREVGEDIKETAPEVFDTKNYDGSHTGEFGSKSINFTQTAIEELTKSLETKTLPQIYDINLKVLKSLNSTLELKMKYNAIYSGIVLVNVPVTEAGLLKAYNDLVTAGRGQEALELKQNYDSHKKEINDLKVLMKQMKDLEFDRAKLLSERSKHEKNKLETEYSKNEYTGVIDNSTVKISPTNVTLEQLIGFEGKDFGILAKQALQLEILRIKQDKMFNNLKYIKKLIPVIQILKDSSVSMEEEGKKTSKEVIILSDLKVKTIKALLKLSLDERNNRKVKVVRLQKTFVIDKEGAIGNLSKASQRLIEFMSKDFDDAAKESLAQEIAELDLKQNKELRAELDSLYRSIIQTSEQHSNASEFTEAKEKQQEVKKRKADYVATLSEEFGFTKLTPLLLGKIFTGAHVVDPKHGGPYSVSEYVKEDRIAEIKAELSKFEKESRYWQNKSQPSRKKQEVVKQVKEILPSLIAKSTNVKAIYDTITKMQQYISYTQRTLELNISDLVKAVREKDSITLLNKEEVYFRPNYSPQKLDKNLELVTHDFIKSVNEIKALYPKMNSGYLGKLMSLKSNGGAKLSDCYELITKHFTLLEEVRDELATKYSSGYEEEEEEKEAPKTKNEPVGDVEDLTDVKDLFDEIGL